MNGLCVCGVEVNKVGFIYSMHLEFTLRCSHLPALYSFLNPTFEADLAWNLRKMDIYVLLWLFIGL